MYRGRFLAKRTSFLPNPYIQLKAPYSTNKHDTVSGRPVTSVLIANRGEIALRVGRTASEYGIKTTTIYTDPDAKSQHALSSANAVNLGHPSAYLDGEKIIAAAKHNGCVAIHPGYGFLSENSAFAKRCLEAGLVFIGPPWEAIEEMGNKSRSKEIMTDAGVPCIPGYHGGNQDPTVLKAEAEKIGFPVLLKAVKGGGGKGMRIAMNINEFHQQLDSAKSEAKSSFGDDTMLVERYITTPRHIEVQIFADKHGNCVALGERDCSIQRRHQKILEESPAPNLDDRVRKDLWKKACAAALAVRYEGAGTVEFIFDNDSGNFFFMEMNTRLQVEHPVTEMVTGQDLVHWQFIVAEGGKLPLSQTEIEGFIAQRGHAIEARIYAENPEMGFVPDSGQLLHLRLPRISDTVRVDAGFVAGDEVSAHYDPMIAKLIVRGPTRSVAISKLREALEEYQIAGVATNIAFLKRVCSNDLFKAGDVETGFIEKQKDLLFLAQKPDAQVLAQASLALLMSSPQAQGAFTKLAQPGFGSPPQKRSVRLATINVNGTHGTEMPVEVRPVGLGLFDVEVGDVKYESIASSWDSKTKTVQSFLPSTRLESTIIEDEGRLVVFQQGEEYHLQVSTPSWVEKAMGLKETKHSVLAPMPCKILRVEVKSGEEVMQDQALVVIESMKMETTIRSPQSGRIARVVHQEGVCSFLKAQ